MTINDFQHKVFGTHKGHGFAAGQDPLVLERKLLLAVGELSEAQGELRAGRDATEVYFEHSEETPNVMKPEGFPIEVCDCIIRCFNILSDIGFDAEYYLQLKADYNAQRPAMHGGKKF